MGDAALAAGLVLLGQLTTWLQLDSADAFAGSRLVNAAVLAVGTAPVLWRRAAPGAVVAVSAAVLCLPHLVADLDVTVLGQFLPLVVVTASCGYVASTRTALIGVTCAVAGMLVVSWATPFLRTPTSVLFNLLVLVAPWSAARGLRHREDRARELGAQLALERADSAQRTAEAVRLERAAIARDLHDVVAHGVSVMVVQIGGARMQLGEDPVRASDSLLHAENAGRDALADLRRMLGVLRAPPSTRDAEPRASLRDLDALLRQVRDAGVAVDVHLTGDIASLPATVDVCGYRIVQEALTNVIKHSGADQVHLQVVVADGQLRLRVRDSGGIPPNASSTGAGGHGLVGVRERVAFLGGQAAIGPDTAGGWVVDVTIPVVDVAHGREHQEARA